MYRKLVGLFSVAILTAFGSATDAFSQAQQYTSYVAKFGSGTACTRASPCNNLSAAVAITVTDGVVVCLEGGDFGPFTISRSIIIDCSNNPGNNEGSTLGDQGGNGAAVTINIPTSEFTRRVTLRGLTLWNGDRGVWIQSAAFVEIDNCLITASNKQGILDQRTGGQTKLFVKDTVITMSGGAGIVASSGAPGVMVLDHVSLVNNLYGVAAASGNNVTLRNSIVSGNTQAGVEADGGAQVTVESSTITNNNSGVLAGGTVRLLRNNISFNNQAVSGSAISLGGNVYSGNAAIGATPPLASGASGDVYN